MLERLFGSASRAKIIKFFCTRQPQKYYLRELARTLDIKLNALSRELVNLHQIGLLSVVHEQHKKYFSLDERSPLLPELRALIYKSIVLLERALVRDLRSVQGLQVLILTGIFNNQDTETDILLVGPVNRKKIQKLVKDLSRAFYQDIRFTIFSTTEYRYRLEVTDKFVYKILNLSPIIIINKIVR